MLNNNLDNKNFGELGMNARPITYVIENLKELHKHYMPFVKGGGIFLKKEDGLDNYQLGSKVFVLLTLLDDNVKKTISGKIVWINRSPTNRGIGVSLGEGEQAKLLKAQIDQLLLQLPNKKDLTTYTI